MVTPLTLTTARSADGTVVLAAVGEIDMSNSADLASAMARLPEGSIVDLTDVEYLDSAGLSVLFAHADRIEEVVVPALLAPVASISGLATVAKVRDPG